MYGMYVNCRKSPFIDQMFDLSKPYESRPRNVLKAILGERVALIETGKGKPMIRGEAVISGMEVVPYENKLMRQLAKIIGTDYDILPGGKKCFYKLTAIKEYDEPLPVPEWHINHGRSYTEF